MNHPSSQTNSIQPNEPYTIILVDDESEIRQGMIHSIDWHAWGFRVIGEAENGIQAVTLIEKYRPDVVLSDIRMPGMDGLELMRFVRENYPDISFVVLSGYSDFAYMERAIEHEVFTYLLKPTDLTAFENTFRKLKISLDEKRKEKEKLSALQDSLAESVAYMRDSVFTQIMKGSYPNNDETITLLEKERLSDGFAGAGIVAVIPTYTPEWFAAEGREWPVFQRLAVSLMNQAIRGSRHCRGTFFLYEQKNICGILRINEAQWPETRQMLQEKLRVQANMGTLLFPKSLCYVQSALDFQKAYETVCMDLTPAENRAAPSAETAEFSPPTAQQMMALLSCGEIPPIAQLLESLFAQTLRDAPMQMGEINITCMQFLFQISGGAKNLGVNLPTLLEADGYFLESLYDFPSLSGKKSFLLYCIRLILGSLGQQQALDANVQLVNDMYAIIQQYCCSDQLSLGMIAERLQRNESYISRVFKEVAGISFFQFVQEKRMQKAMQLLQKSAMWVYEVAASVGYPDTSTFMRAFKKHVGKTPAEYRRTVKGGE